MAEDHFAILLEVARAQNELQQKMLAQNQQRALEGGLSFPTFIGKREVVLNFVETVNREAIASH
jgi:hypothetical protein